MITTKNAVRCVNKDCNKINNVDGSKDKQDVKCKWCGTVFFAERRYKSKGKK